MKKIILICMVSLITAISLTGCTNIDRNNIDLSNAKTEIIDESIQKIEVLNILNDANLFGDLIIKLESQMKDNTIEQQAIVFYDFMNDIYKLATNRIAADIGTIYINSGKYTSYIAMLQVYTDTFNEEKEVLYDYLIKDNKEIEKLKSYRMFCELEKFYLDILEEGINKETAE